MEADRKPIVNLYYWTLKQFMGIRKTIPNDVCYAKVVYVSLPDCVKFMQHKYYSRQASEKSRMADDPLIIAIDIAGRGNIGRSRTIRRLMDTNVRGMSVLIQNEPERITASSGSRCAVYPSLKANLTIYSI